MILKTQDIGLPMIFTRKDLTVCSIGTGFGVEGKQNHLELEEVWRHLLKRKDGGYRRFMSFTLQ